ncbi:hypothetical protein CPB86DRAFT_825759 [Serendipita vermifera]|nr:hypothetical protein CPB86DRAFT_825759 [Serendipita vermifera]
MNSHYNPAVRRVPIDIWWNILDEVIEDEALPICATTFAGRDWSGYSRLTMSGHEKIHFDSSEKQRKVIGCVCRLWRAVAEARRNRYIDLGEKNVDKYSSQMTKVLRARSVKLWSGACDMIFKHPSFSQGVNWEVAEIHVHKAENLSRIPHPRLRRLKLTFGGFGGPSDTNPFLHVLSLFTNLTWLEYRSNASNGRLIPLYDDTPPIVLPNLQVFWYKNSPIFTFPFTHLVLPSLQYLSLYAYNSPTRATLIKILTSYRQTIRSFTALSAKGGATTALDLPSWNDFPNLEELVLDRHWVFHVQPLPSNHPLKRLEVHHDSFGVIPSLLEGVDMRTITLKGAKWPKEGGVADPELKLTVNKIMLDDFLRQAETRGINFKASHRWQAYLTREEASIG